MNTPRQIPNDPMDEPKKKPFYSDISFWSLIAANLAVIVLARTKNWSLVSLLWVHWSQSLIIGLFWFFRIVELKDFDAQGATTQDTLAMWGLDDWGAKGSKMEEAFETRSQLAAGHIFLYVSIHVGFVFWIRSLTSASAPANLWPVS